MDREAWSVQVLRLLQRGPAAPKLGNCGPRPRARWPGPGQVRAPVALGLRGIRPGVGLLRGH